MSANYIQKGENKMKKTLKALLCVVLALSMVFSFAGCSDDEPVAAPPVEESGKSEDNAKAAVEAVMEDVLAYDVDAIEEKLDFECVDKEEILGELGDEELADLYAPIVEKMFDEYVDSFEYEITEFGKDDGVYTAEVKFTCLDTDAITESLEGGDSESMGEELVMEMLADGRITMDMSEEEFMDAIMKEMAPLLEEMMDEAIKDAGTKTMYLDFVVVKDGDEWVIDTESSNYDDLIEELGKDAEEATEEVTEE